MVQPLLRVLDLRTGEGDAAFAALCARNAGFDEQTDARVHTIVQDVRTQGDAALLQWTQTLEGRSLTTSSMVLETEAMRAAYNGLAPDLRDAIDDATSRIVAFHRTQHVTSSSRPMPGVTLQSRAMPLERVAVYVPGGTAAYPSSVLMAAVPARIAGVQHVFVLTPRPSQVVLAACHAAGVDRVYAVGGAQAIAAAAFGTATMARADKIVGPGNAFVTAAKRQVFGYVAIDGIAGPSEILIAADRSAAPELIAADLLSQAEHDPQACALWVTDDANMVDAVEGELHAQLATLPRVEIARAALRDHGACVLVSSLPRMLEVINAYAPEHLELLVADPERLLPGIRHAGAIFVGPWTPEAAGDYTAGPSHVLPTAGAARFASALGVWDFVKYSSIIALDEASFSEQASAIVALAEAEGLQAHARAVTVRMKRRTQ